MMTSKKWLPGLLEPGKCAYTAYGKRGKDETYLYSHLNRTRDEAIAIWNRERVVPAFSSVAHAELCCKGTGRVGIITCKDLR